MPICNFSYKECGPFAQTLFLGCSVANIGQNLAWGSEPSTCTIKLIKDLSSHPSDPAFLPSTTYTDTITSTADTVTNTLFDPTIDGADLSHTLRKNIAQQEKNIEATRLVDDITNISQVSLKDLGKKCWNPHNLAANPIDWVGPDPGFVGDNSFMGRRLFGVAGVPCYFRFDTVMFGGLINKWTYEGGTYSVELMGPGSMLKGVKLIINEYYGSISTLISSTAGALPGGNSLAIPYGDTSINSYTNTIIQGNIPNVINIFGFLQNIGYGSTLISQYGVNASQIYDTLNLLLNNSNGIQTNQFSPYGAIVAKSLIEYTNNNNVGIVNPENASLTYGGKTINLTHLGLMNHKMAVDQVFRPLFRLDLSQVPRPDPNIYMDLTNVIELDQFITFCCDGAGMDWNTEIIPDLSGTDFTGRIVINTYNRNIQPPPKVLKNLVSTFGAADRVISFNAGEEYSDEQVRKIVIGGKQERLFQVMNHTLSRYRNIRVFDIATGNFMPIGNDMTDTTLSTGDSRNTIRWPRPSSTRAYDSSFGLPYRTYGGAATAQTDNDFLSSETLGFSNTTVTKGNYTTTTPPLKDAEIPSFPSPGRACEGYSGYAYPISYDLISPYFGRNTDGSIRKVFYDRKLRQLQVNVSLSDLQPFFPVQGTGGWGGFITFYENEIRAAIAGFDSWLSYVLEPVKFGFSLPSTSLIQKFIADKHGQQIANQIILGGLGILKGQTKMSALPVAGHTGNRISPGNSIPYLEGIFDTLKKLHQFIASNLGEHYGKNFLVRLPNIQRRVGPDGIAYYSYQVCDSGWEEQGNFLDDTMQIGTAAATALATENGKFPPILGFNASAEWDNATYFDLDSMSPWGRTLMSMRSKYAEFSEDKWYFPLVHDLDPDKVVIMPYESTLLNGTLRPGFNTNPPTLNDSYGRSIPDDKKYKMYVTGSILETAPENKVNKNIIFSENAQYCVVSNTSKIHYASHNSLVKTMYEDLYTSVVEGIEQAIEPGMIQSRIRRGNCINPNTFLVILGLLDHVFNTSAFPPSISLGGSEQHLPIAAKCPTPCFAAIPIRDNLSIYGPWISHPGLISNIIFPDLSQAGANAMTNNIVGGVDVDISDSYVPWEYGGMDLMDTAILTKLADNNKYQQVLEAGSLTVAGIMLRDTHIGSTLINNYGPVCNSIQVAIGTDGYQTTYHFRTYSRKLGYFNKNQSDLMQKFGKQALTNRKELVDSIRSQLTRTMQLRDPAADRAGRLPKGMAYSPVNVLVGGSYPMIHSDSSLTDAYTQLKFNPDWHLRPIIPTNLPSDPKNMLRQQTVSQIYDPQELDGVLGGSPRDYESRAIMSLDGLFSPISFYPTKYGTTYSISYYPRSKCPHCKGQGTYTYKEFTQASTLLNPTNTNSSDATTTTIKDSFTEKTKSCDFCVPDDKINKKTSAQPNETTPPFLLASGTDLQIISDRDTSFQYNSCIINNYTLNPMIMSATGSDYSCYMNKQKTDRCGHSIDIVSFGNTLPKLNDGLRASLSPTINKNYNDYDINLIEADASFQTPLQNVRFFGLRGPLMLHSWGYDLEGYPIPNSSGEYQLQANGDIKRDNEGNPVFKNQVQQADGKYSAPYKDNTFFKGWGQLPSTWPVGPIDLRWDSGANVWTIGANYKPVWVAIENDLLDDNPVRGAIIESSYSNSPLPSGLRKLVFVKDTAGMFSAPRGAALYCRYDSQNGFYEPIYNRPLLTSGTINGPNTVSIYKAYVPASLLDLNTEEVLSYNTTYSNPLDLDADTNSVGLFTFLNGQWILMSTKM
jgi:hypothetical protein